MMTNGKLLKSNNLVSKFARRKIKLDVNFIIENVFKIPSGVIIFLFNFDIRTLSKIYILDLHGYL